MIRRKKSLPARLSAALLALVLTLALVPAGRAFTDICPQCKAACEVKVVREPNCHEEGVYEYLCTNTQGNCPMAGKSNLVKGSTDPKNHDAVYSDEGNGYHTGLCSHHNPAVSIPAEPHEFNNGVCTKCGAVDYSDVKMNLPKELTVPVALNNSEAKLSVGEIRLTLGSANVTDDYSITYNWYYNGSPVASTEEYLLPSTITGKEGTYYYTLFVSAVPKSSLRQNVSGSCNVTVRVEELITASATISTDESTLFLGDPDTWSGESVSTQIYAAVQDLCPRNEDPDYVVFHTLPNSTVGSLGVSALSTPYYFEDSVRRNALDDVKFTVNTGSGSTTGDYTVGFTAYDTKGNDYAGVLTITVQQYAGDMDVVLTTSRNTAVTLSTEDFEDFWAKTHPSGVLDSISFRETPRSTEGSLYVDYVSASAPGVRVTTKDSFYVEPGRRQYGIDAVTFLPGVKQTDYITLDFTAEGTRNNGRSTSLDGTLYIFFSNSGSADVAITAAAGGTVLSPESFQKAYQTATGGTGSSFYIQLLDVPARGELYVGRTATRQGTLLTAKNISNYPFSYSDSRGESISSVTYVPASGVTSESVRYVACSSQGKPLYTGKITFTSGASTVPPTTTGLVLNLTSPSTGVKLTASSFENLANPKLTMVSFTPPAASYGAFYYGRTETNPGTPITSSNSYFSASSTNAIAGALSLNDLTFVPNAGYTGVVPIAFSAFDAANNRCSGTLRITVTASGTTNPGTTTPGTTTPGTTTPGTTTPVTPTQPAKTFSDVPKTAGSYPYITALTTTGAIDGYPDGSFKPGNPVLLGEALKLIMSAVNPTEYSNLAPTSSHWASGYLARAIQDGLLPASTTEKDLERNANRYTIAEISTKVLKLAPVENAAATPFADMPLTNASAKYVLALYNAKIVTGSTNKSGQVVYYGVNAITREEFATIVWRMQSYTQNGFVGTVAVG